MKGRKQTRFDTSKRLESFARQYVILGFNGERAAIAAGYARKNAKVTASRLLTKANVKALVQRFAAPIEKKLDFSVHRTLEQIARHAFVDPRRLFNADNSIKRIADLDEDTAACVHAIEHTGKRTDKVRLTNQLHALELLARYHKLFADDVVQQDTGIRVIVVDAPRPPRLVGSGPATTSNGNGHNGNGNGHSNGHKPDLDD
jgi:phage terminase small subunit